MEVICKRCSAAELLSIEKIKEQIPEYLKSISEDIRVSDKEYNKRLECCYGCEGLAGGIMCRYCGCFVLMRALIKTKHCPSPAAKLW